MVKKAFVLITILTSICSGVAFARQTPVVPKPVAPKSRKATVARPPKPPMIVVPAVAPVMNFAMPLPAQLQATVVVPAPAATISGATFPTPVVVPRALVQTPAPTAAPVQTPNPQPAQRSRAASRPRPSQPAPPVAEPAQAEPVTVPLPRGGVVLVTSRAGDVKINGWDKEEIWASAAGDEGGVKIEVNATGEPQKKRVYLSMGAGRRSDVTIEVKVPRYAEVETLDNLHGDIAVADVDGAVRIGEGHGDVTVERVGSLRVQRRGGDIVVRDVKGDVFARGSQGDIQIENTGQSVDVTLSSGDLTVHKAGGNVRVNAAAGDVDIRCAKGRADVSSASGSISLIGVEGEVEASTASGDVKFAGVLRPNGTYRLKSVSGEVEMGLPADSTGFTATLITYTGAMQIDFPLKAESIQGGTFNRKITGKYKDGGANITLDSFNGEVRIVKISANATKECK